MAITHFGTVATPEDAASEIAEPVTSAVTPPGSMVAGDLVVFTGFMRTTTTGLMSISNNGGQTWNDLGEYGTTNSMTAHKWWCEFDGTWDANPSIAFAAAGGTVAATVVMRVFHQSTAGRTWAVDVAQTAGGFAAPTTPFTVTRAGQTTVADDTVSLADWFSSDDNSYTSISGTDWVVTGTAQYRNTAGTDMSGSFAHKIQTAQGATGDVSKNQTTITGDAGFTAIVTFRSAAVPSQPSAPTATEYGEDQINLSWSAPASNGAPITGYKIERESPTGGGFSTIVADTASTATTYRDAALSVSTQYNYRISAINVAGTSTASSGGAATTEAAGAISIVGTPQLGGAADGGNVTLTFDGSPAEGDMVLVFGGGPARSGFTAGPTTGGYTSVQSGATTGSGTEAGDRKWNVSRKFLTSSPDTTVVGGGSANAADGTAYASIVLRGVDPSTPIDVAVVSAEGMGNSSGAPFNWVLDPPSITPTTAYAWIFVFGLNRGGSATGSPFIEGYRYEVGVQANDDEVTSLVLGRRIQKTAGAENAGAFQDWGVGNTLYPWAGVAVAIRPGSSTRTGDAALTLPALQSAGTATIPVIADNASNLAALTSAGTATIPVTADGSVTLSALQAESTASVYWQATGDATLPALVTSGTATIPVTADGAVTLAPLQSTSTAAVLVFADGAAPLGTLQASATAVVPVDATSAVTLPALQAEGTASIGLAGASADGAVPLPALQASATAIIPVTADAALTLGALQAATTATVPVDATAALTLPAITSSSTAVIPVAADGSAILPALQAAATATIPVSADGAAPLSALQAIGTAVIAAVTGDGAVPLPALQAAATATVPVTATGAVILPALTSSAIATIPVTADGIAILSALDTDATATIPVTGDGSAPLPALQAAGTGGIPGVTGDGAASLPALQASATADVPVVANGAISLPGLSVAASATVAVTANADVMLAAVTASASGTMLVTGDGVVLLPALDALGSTVPIRRFSSAGGLRGATMTPTVGAGTAALTSTITIPDSTLEPG